MPTLQVLHAWSELIRSMMFDWDQKFKPMPADLLQEEIDALEEQRRGLEEWEDEVDDMIERLTP